MTQAKFWKLAKRRTWRILRRRGLVRSQEGFCPLVAVQHTLKVPRISWNASRAADRLGLSDTFTAKVVHGADSRAAPERPWLLRKLGVTDA